MKKYDVVVIGGGPGGYVASIKAAQLGKKVACIDNSPFLGGTCLNVGCIPSKSLLNSTHKYYDAKNKFGEFGITFSDLAFSLDKMMKKKDESLQGLAKGIEGLFKKNKIDHFRGTGSFFSTKEVEVLTKDGKEMIGADNVIIATGSSPVYLKNIEIDEKNIVTSTGALSLPSVPKTMAVIGAGVIGVEMASVWARLGAEVTLIEHGSDILPSFDHDIQKEAKKIFEKQGMIFRINAKVTKAAKKDSDVEIQIEDAKTGSLSALNADVLLVAVGRKPNTQFLNLDKVGIEVNQSGRIAVNHNFQTNKQGVYAIGDVIDGPMLAHKASDEGVAVAEIISSQHGHVNYNTIPSVVYTSPEIAFVGKTENEITRSGISCNIGKFPFMANSRARVSNEAEGFVKIIADKKTDEVLGVHIIGPGAGELIAEAATAMEFKAASEDMARICNPHPTLNEALKEAALATYFKPIHF